MIIKCDDCNQYFDDQFRSTYCPHNTFLANDGQNNFKHYDGAWLADHSPSKEKFATVSAQSESTSYQNWLNENEIKNG